MGGSHDDCDEVRRERDKRGKMKDGWRDGRGKKRKRKRRDERLKREGVRDNQFRSRRRVSAEAKEGPELRISNN